MPMFLCRWPNGDFSVVSASDKADAIERLDEFANAEQAKLWKMSDCLINFRLDDLGEFELCDMGAATTEFIVEKCYPALEQVVTDAERGDDEEYTPAAVVQIRAAVEHERTRQELAEPKQADTEAGRHGSRPRAATRDGHGECRCKPSSTSRSYGDFTLDEDRQR